MCYSYVITRYYLLPFVILSVQFLQAYLDFVRPRLVQKDVPNNDRFFLNGEGGAVRSCLDLVRFHETYNVRPVTSIELRRALETEANGSLNDVQKAGIEHYMCHSAHVAYKIYREKTTEQLFTIASTIRRFTGYVHFEFS